MSVKMQRIGFRSTAVICYLTLLLLATTLISAIDARERLVILQNETRSSIHISAFGFLKYGYLEVKMNNLQIHDTPISLNHKVGFTIDSTWNNWDNPYPKTMDLDNRCPLNKDSYNMNYAERIFFSFDFSRKLVDISCSGVLQNNKIFHNAENLPKFRDGNVEESGFGQNCPDARIELEENTLPDGSLSYSTQFVVWVGNGSEGLYNLYFHHCFGEQPSEIRKLNMTITEQNSDNNALSAGEMLLPAVYLTLSLLFFISGCYWAFILMSRKKQTGVSVFNIHYMMGALVFLKSLSLFFRSIIHQKFQKYGTSVEPWDILYVNTYLAESILLFITILLIGSGYAFTKRLLSKKEKFIFTVVILMQIFVNVAGICLTDLWQENMATYRVVLTSFDLMCCGAVMFPIIMSIRHLESRKNDGMTLTLIRIFRHFYMIVVVYFYFTRIIVNMLLKITFPFHYVWLLELCYHVPTLVFFVLTGYKFRPAKNDHYLALSHSRQSDDKTAGTQNYYLTEGVPNLLQNTFKFITPKLFKQTKLIDDRVTLSERCE